MNCAVHKSLWHVASNHCMLSKWHVFTEGGERNIPPSISSLAVQCQAGRGGEGGWGEAQGSGRYEWGWFTDLQCCLELCGPAAPLPSLSPFLFPFPSSRTQSIHCHKRMCLRLSVKLAKVTIPVNYDFSSTHAYILQILSGFKTSLMSSTHHENTHRLASTSKIIQRKMMTVTWFAKTLI